MGVCRVTLLLVLLYFTLLTKHSSRIYQKFCARPHSKHLTNISLFKCPQLGTCLVAQWLRIRLPMQGTRV